MSALVFSHIPLPHPTHAILPSTPLFFPPIFLSLSHYSFLLPLYKPPPPSISVGLSLGTPTVRRENMAQIPLSHIPKASTETCERYTINMRFALGTVSKRQMPANASKTDSKACRENKKMWGKTGKTQEDTAVTHVSHGCYYFWTQTFELEISLISPAVVIVLA